MINMICRIEIKNVNKDVLASRVLDELMVALKSENDSINEIEVEKTILPNEKCEVTFAISIVVSVISGLITNAIYDYLKKVCGRINFGKRKLTFIIRDDETGNTEVVISKLDSGELLMNIEKIK